MSGRFALLVGTTDYADRRLPHLNAPESDLRALSEVLKAPGPGGFHEAHPCLNAPSDALRREVARFFRNRSSEDLLLLYFSCHGVLDEEGQLYLAAKDTDRDLLSATAVPASFVSAEMDRCLSRRQVLILDCCNSGAFARGTKGAEEMSAQAGSAFRGSGFGRVILTATDSVQPAWEGEALGLSDKSVFTNYLVEGVRSGAADLDGDGEITVDEFYDYAFRRSKEDGVRQTPGKWVYRLQGTISIARNPVPRPAPDRLPHELLELVHASSPAGRRAAVDELKPLLAASNVGQALAARQLLERLVDDDSKKVAEAARAALKTPSQPLDGPPAVPPLGTRDGAAAHTSIANTPKSDGTAETPLFAQSAGAPPEVNSGINPSGAASTLERIALKALSWKLKVGWLALVLFGLFCVSFFVSRFRDEARRPGSNAGDRGQSPEREPALTKPDASAKTHEPAPAVEAGATERPNEETPTSTTPKGHRLAGGIDTGTAVGGRLDKESAVDAKKAAKLYKQGSYEEAAKVYLRLSVDHPSMPVYARYLGACYYYLRRPERALSNLREYLARKGNDITPDDRAEVDSWIAEMNKLLKPTAAAGGLDQKSMADAQKAKQLYKQGSYEEAAKVYLRLSVDHPSMPVFVRNLGACYYYLHRSEPALSNLREYLARKGNAITPDDRAEVDRWIAEMSRPGQSGSPTAPAAGSAR